MAVLKEISNGDITFKCPGCGLPHYINYKRDKGPKWSFNGDFNSPTISPSIRVQGCRPLSEAEIVRVRNGEDLSSVTAYLCHSFITDGKIQFLMDCTHDLKGQTVSLDHWME